MAKAVKFTINVNVNGKNVIAQASTSSKELAVNLGLAEEKSNSLKESLFHFNQVTRSFQDVFNSLQQLTGAMHSFTQAYGEQQQAETLLATAMRNTMGATDAQIQGIKDLTAAQQELGVVGDEIQLAGAKVLATHIKHSETLRTLIPLMNDMAVAQDGLNVSSSTTSNIAGLLGKAMEGNINALKKMGISFTVTQEQILKTGTEEQRAAVLTQVLSARFGGMNQALANTASGGLKQVENSLGDLKEKFGAIYSHIEPLIKKVGSLGLALSGLGQTISAIKAVSTKIKELNTNIKAAETSSKALKITLASIGIGAAIVLVWGLVDAFKALRGSQIQASAAAEDLKAAEEAGTQASAAARVEIDKEITKLGELIKSKGDTRTAVQELNDKYGEWFGQCSTAQQWYDTLIASSEAYCNQLAYEAQARVLAEKKAALEIKQERNRQKQEKLREEGRDKTTSTSLNQSQAGAGFVYNSGTLTKVATKEMKELQTEAKQTGAELKEINAQIAVNNDLMANNKPIAPKQKTPVSPRAGGAANKSAAGTVKGTPEYIAGQLGYFDQEISKLNQQKLKLSDPADIYNLDQMIRRLEDARTLLQYISSLKPGEREGFAGLLAGGASATSQAGGGSLAPGGMTGDDWTKRIADDWESNTKAMKEYFATFQRDFPIQIYDEAKKKAAEHNKKLSDMGGLIQSAGQSFATLGKNLEQPVLEAAGIIAQAIATVLLGYAQATAEGAKLGPIGWIATALAGLATATSVIAQMKSIGQYANGALAFGPTLGIFGEYAGASHNPEVVAPLDRLRSYIGDAGGKGTVEFEIKGRTLRGLLKKENNHVGRG